MWGNGLDGAGCEQEQVGGSCECGNEPSGSIKCGEFLDQAEDRFASQEGLCCMGQISKKLNSGLNQRWRRI